MKPDAFVAALRCAAPYIHAHNGSVIVLSFGGDVADRADFDAFIYDLALLHSLGIRLVLVHGSRPQIDRELERLGLVPRYSGELRITDAAALGGVKAAVGSLRMELEARLSTSLTNTPMGGARIRVSSGNWVTARPVGVRNGVDHEFTGEVRRVDVSGIRAVLEQGRIALVSPVGYSPTGEIFNLRSSDVAREISVALSADKLVMMSNSDPKSWPLAAQVGDVGQLSLGEAAKLLEGAADMADQDRRYLKAGLSAGRAGVDRVHLVGAGADGALLRELFTRDGLGLMMYGDPHYEAVREATVEDVAGVMSLIGPLEQAGVLVPRSREQLELEIRHFDVMMRDGLVVACCALLPSDENAEYAELACIAVRPDYQRAGRADALLKRAEARARNMGVQGLFTLTTHTPHWFIEHGFEPSTLESLPVRKRQLYNFQRNSTVLTKNLT